MFKIINPFSMRLSAILISFMAFTSFFSISVFPNIFNYIFVFGFVVVAFLGLIRMPFLNKSIIVFYGFFIAPGILALFSLLPSMYLNSNGLDYSELSIAGRLFNLSLFVLVIFLAHKYFIKNKSFLLFRWYWLGGFVFMLFALWHAVAIYAPFLSFPFETRSHIHSAGEIDLLAGQRVTGIAREPSYFVPFVVDFIILTMLLVGSTFKRYLLVAFAVVLLFLSLSPSGYMILFGSLAGALSIVLFRYLVRFRIKAKHMLGFIISLGLFFVFFVYFLNTNFSDYILNRFTTLDVESSGRFYMVVMPFVWMQDTNLFTLLFGNGIKTYSIIGTEFLLPSGSPVNVTSNNLFVDTFWESGLIGLLILISFFTYFFLKVLKLKFSTYQVFIAAMILFDLFFSGLVRADFASLRFFLMLYFLFILLNYDMRGLLWKRY